MSFDTMMASATVSTITIAVAADSPPTNAGEREQLGAGAQRQRQHEHVAVDVAAREGQQAGDRDRHDEQVDQHQIERKQPGGAADLGFAVVLDHGDVELARQQHDRDSDSSVMAMSVLHTGSRVSTAAVRGCLHRLANSATGPSNIQKVTNTPTATKATSLTIDSVAIASIRPS